MYSAANMLVPDATAQLQVLVQSMPGQLRAVLVAGGHYVTPELVCISIKNLPGSFGKMPECVIC